MLARSILVIGVAIVALITSFASCESSYRSGGPSGLTVTGKVGEILVVCEQGVWESEIKSYLDTGLTRFIMPYFPDVATFELVHRTPRKFESGIKRYRNTLFVNIDPTFKGDKAKIEMREDVWAKDQLVIDIIGKDFNQVLTVCKGGLNEVHAEFDKIEWKRIMNKFGRTSNSSFDKKIKKNFGIKLDLPSGSKLVTKRDNFFRIEFPNSSRPIDFGPGGQDIGNIMSGVMIYQYKYLNEDQMDLKQLLVARDTMLKYNVPSEVEGQYMGTQYVDFVYPEGNEMTSANGKVKGYEMRGMFQFLGNGKFGTGGAFWAFHFVHPKTNQLVCVSGYVDAPPTTSWTHPLREVQAVLKSVEIAP